MFFCCYCHHGVKDRPNNAEDLQSSLDDLENVSSPTEKRWLEDYFYWDGVFSKLCSFMRGRWIFLCSLFFLEGSASPHP